MSVERIQVSVVLALPSRCWHERLEVTPGTTVGEAMALSRITEHLSPEERAGAAWAIFGRQVSADRVLVRGDRIEVLRPLQRDPKAARRQLAAAGRTLGRIRQS